MNRRSSATWRRGARGAKWDPRQARLLMVGGGALLFVLISAFVWMLSGGPEPKELPAGPAPSAVWMSDSSEESVPEAAEGSEEEPSFSEEPSSRPEDSPGEAASSEETPGVSSEAPSSQTEDSSSGTASSEETPGASDEAPPSQPEDSSSGTAFSEETPGSSSEAPSSQPEDSSSGTAFSEETPGSSSEAPSSQPGDSSSGTAPSEETPSDTSGEAPLSVREAPATIDLNELELPAEEEPDEPAEEPDDGEDAISSSGAQSNPKSHPDAGDEELLVTVGGARQRMNAYDLICRAVQNETNGLLAPEALKAHAVATYTMILYNNERGIAPAVILKTPVSSATEKAVAEVIGQAVYYKGQYANTVYHSTSSGKTTSSQSVWGGALPYLVPVESPYDKKAPGYKGAAAVSRKNFAKRVESVYGIELDGDPSEWITAERDAPGGYVGTVEIGGYTRSQGGSFGTGIITGRSVREQLLSFGIRSHCFEVRYDEEGDRFLFTTYGYGHGVGMSQYGAHYMALDGYDYLEILEHYYTGVTVE